MTYFYNIEGEQLASVEGILLISLYKGMKITLHGYSNPYEVEEWQYHYGHPEEESALKIFLRNGTTPGGRSGN